MIKGRAYKNEFTKKLTENVSKNNIAIIKHRAIDLVAAQDLLYRNVKAIINCEKTIDKKYSLDGINFMLDNKMKIYDISDKNFFDTVLDGDLIYIDNLNKIYINKRLFSNCVPVTKYDCTKIIDENKKNAIKSNYCFIKNTMKYINCELEYFIHENKTPEIITNIKDREVIIVSRGRNYREDLKTVKRFIINKNIIIISVDGGANAITDIGLKSNIIIGDMDSVNDRSLFNCNEILIHQYSNGYAPGLNRIQSMGLGYKLLQIKGTSEDAAIYMAKLKGASTIYMIGSHTGIEEFTEKGRGGMGSTTILRMLIGSKIVDLKGVSTVTKYNHINFLKTITISLTVFIITYILYSIKLFNTIETCLKYIIGIR